MVKFTRLRGWLLLSRTVPLIEPPLIGVPIKFTVVFAPRLGTV